MPPRDSDSSLISQDTNNGGQSETPYLDSYEPSTRLANYNRKELDLGKCLGQGRFTETREIRKVDRDLHYKPSSADEEKARLDIWENARTKGRSNFTIKRVRKDLKTEREIERAALGLTIEANYLSRLDHQNIIQLKGMCQTMFTLGPDTYEYHAIITNRTTETLCERIDYWSEQDSLSRESDFILHLKTDYAFQIADALSYLHERRIVFRNLTLSSIGFTTSDTIQLTNFDCVKEIPEGESYLQDGFKGSQTYMSLEMYSGKKYDYKVDCFSWAICFYEMLLQEPAFQSTTNEGALIREHGWSPSLEDADFVPDGLLDLLEDAWETDLEERFTMKDIKGQLEWILFGTDEEDGSVDESNPTLDASAETTGYLNLGMDDYSALGLDLSESGNFDMGGDEDINAALGFSGTRGSFIPDGLLLHADEVEAAPTGPAPPCHAPNMNEILPKLEYTSQYRGLRLETIPPLSFVPATANQGRRRSIQGLQGGRRKSLVGGRRSSLEPRRRSSHKRQELAPCA